MASSSADQYKPTFMYENVFTGIKTPAGPVPKIMQNIQQKEKRTMLPYSNPNVGSTSSNVASTNYSRVYEDFIFLRRAMNDFNLNVSPPPTVVAEDDQHLDESPAGTYNRNSARTMATVAKIVQKRRRGRKFHPGSRRLLFDRTASEYSWLPSGWLGEERIMETGRIYRFYYDCNAKFYDTRYDAVAAVDRLKKKKKNNNF